MSNFLLISFRVEGLSWFVTVKIMEKAVQQHASGCRGADLPTDIAFGAGRSKSLLRLSTRGNKVPFEQETVWISGNKAAKLLNSLTLAPLTWTKWRAPTNASKWRMGFNSAFKWLKIPTDSLRHSNFLSIPDPVRSHKSYHSVLTHTHTQITKWSLSQSFFLIKILDVFLQEPGIFQPLQ